MNPSKWEFHDFLPCNEPSSLNKQVSFFTILMNVQLEAFMWGFGTAIGELPPYFMARAAAEAGKKNEEVEEVEELSKLEVVSWMDKAKRLIYHHLKKHGFITVLICASVSLY